jgi:DNA replication protein DnaC
VWKRREPREIDLQNANVPQRKWGADLSKIDPKLKYVEQVQAYLDNLERNLKVGDGLLLYGPYRSGKSCIAATIVREVAAHKCRAYWIEADELMRGWDKEDHRYRRARNAHLLVIDDLGIEGSAAYPLEVMGKALRYRLERACATVITTNMPPEKLEKHYGEKMIALMKECLIRVHVTGMDWSADDDS